MLIRLIYASYATAPFDVAELDALLETSRRRNAADGITGMLLYRDGDFLQVLEGEEPAVRSTFARIERDPRHAGLVVLDDSSIARREFAEWSMAFRRVEREEVPEGFDDFLRRRSPGQRSADGGEAARFLAIFRDLGR